MTKKKSKGPLNATGKSRMELMGKPPADEFLDPLRHEILEHGGVVHVIDPSMGMDIKEVSVSAYLLRGMYHELRQIRIHLSRIDDNLKYGNSG